jgi:serine/threonine-protein kinase
MSVALSPVQWERVKTLFESAVDLPPDRWGDHIRRESSGDQAVQAEVLRLLASVESSTGFLERPALASLAKQFDPVFSPGDLVLNRFLIRGLMGKGGMGEVYKAEDTAVGGVLAIKTVRASFLDRPETVDRLRQEVLLAHRIVHPNVCPIYDLHETRRDNGRPLLFLTMKLLEGRSLAEALAKGVAPDCAAELLLQMARGLAAAHREGVVHCDFKPANVLLVGGTEGKEQPVITDFGIARVADEPGAIAGTPDYMAPEQFDSGQTSPASDVYAFGVTALEVLGWRRASGSARAARGCPKRVELQEGLANARNLNRRLAAVLERCVREDPAQRYTSGSELATALLRVQTAGQRLLRIAGAAVLIPVGLLVFWAGGSAPAPPLRVAVLPLSDATPDRSLEYLADGLTDELIRDLGRVSGVQVVGRTSAFQFKGQTDIAAIGKRLSASRVLRGSISRAGDGIQTHVELLDSSSGWVLWQHDDERPKRDSRAIQVNVALAIAGAFRLHLPPPQIAVLRGHPTANPDAFNAYLLARRFAGLRTAAGWEQSIERYRAALSLDPSLAPAWAGLADAYNMLTGRPGHPIGESVRDAKTAALRALEIDPTQPEAHATMGLLCQRADWNWRGAESHFRAAVTQGPGVAVAHQWYGGLLSLEGRHAEALAELRIARDLDPLSLPVNTAYGGALLRARRLDEAEKQLEFTRSLAPNFPNAYPLLAEVYEVRSDWEKAVAAHQRAIELSTDPKSGVADPQFVAALAYDYAKVGRALEARQTAADLEAQGASPVAIAHVYTGLGDYDRAIDWLEQGYAHRDPTIASIQVEPANDPLRSYPRFTTILQKIGLRP